MQATAHRDHLDKLRICGWSSRESMNRFLECEADGTLHYAYRGLGIAKAMERLTHARMDAFVR